MADATIKRFSENDDNSARLRVAHLSPGAQQAAAEVAVYVTANGADLPAQPNFSFSFGGDVGLLELAAGTWCPLCRPE